MFFGFGGVAPVVVSFVVVALVDVAQVAETLVIVACVASVAVAPVGVTPVAVAVACGCDCVFMRLPRLRAHGLPVWLLLLWFL